MEDLLYVIPAGTDKEKILSMLKEHSEIKFVSLVGIDLAGNDTDEKIPIRIFLKDIDDSSSKHMAGSDDHTLYVIKMPFFFYYTFLSSTTTNVYEFPCKVDGDLLYSSDGTKGWGSTAFDLQVVQDAAHSMNGIVGKVADALLGNIRMLYLAPWNAMEGWQTNEEDITIKVNLFNDTLEAAVANFICVNTLIGNNKYVQYGIF